MQQQRTTLRRRISDMRQDEISVVSSQSTGSGGRAVLSAQHPPADNVSLQQRTDGLCEEEQRWRDNFVFRAMILGLHLLSSWFVALIMLAPALYSGCNDDALVPTLIVMVMLPAAEMLVNWRCHLRSVSSTATRYALAIPLTLYYLAIVLFDVATHVMDYNPAADAGESACALRLTTMPNYRAVQEMLVDFTFHFFVITCILEGLVPRLLLFGAHCALWVCDNLTYQMYSSAQVPRHQLVWQWSLFFMNEVTMMGTALMIAFALEQAQRAQIKRQVEQTELRLRAVQLEEEKERLLWEARLREHSWHQREVYLNRVLKYDAEDEDSGTANSHHTAKVHSGMHLYETCEGESTFLQAPAAA